MGDELRKVLGLRELLRIRDGSPEPLHMDGAHESGRAFDAAAEDIERAPDADADLRSDLGDVCLNELFLTGNAHGDEEDVRLGAGDLLSDHGIALGREVAMTTSHDVAPGVAKAHALFRELGNPGSRTEEVDTVALSRGKGANLVEDVDAAYTGSDGLLLPLSRPEDADAIRRYKVGGEIDLFEYRIVLRLGDAAGIGGDDQMRFAACDVLFDRIKRLRHRDPIDGDAKNRDSRSRGGGRRNVGHLSDDFTGFRTRTIGESAGPLKIYTCSKLS